MFENGIPNVYGGPFDSGESILEWIISESSGDHTIGQFKSINGLYKPYYKNKKPYCLLKPLIWLNFQNKN